MRLFSLLLMLVFLSCTKDTCEPPQQITFEQNGPVYNGWRLNLETLSVGDGLYHWTGPNGWEMKYESYASNANQQERQDVTSQDGGEYKVKVYNSEGCLTHEGATMIEVLPSPVIPCNIPPNTSTSTVAGIGNYNFTNRTFSVASNFYMVYGSEGIGAGQNFMRFAFYGGAVPLPGVHTTTNSAFGGDYGTVGLFIETITYQFYANPGQKIYVTKVNNKLSISFCSLTFHNPLQPANPIKITANLMQP